MTYIYDGQHYDDYDPAFMAALGMKDDTIESVIAQRNYELGAGQLVKRQLAYIAESDPLFLEWQYDKTPAAEQTWRDKVAEIKLRYPVARGAEE